MNSWKSWILVQFGLETLGLLKSSNSWKTWILEQFENWKYWKTCGASKAWFLDYLNSWRLEILSSWKRWKAWILDFMKSWILEILKSRNPEVFKSSHVGGFRALENIKDVEDFESPPFQIFKSELRSVVNSAENY